MGRINDAVEAPSEGKGIVKLSCIPLLLIWTLCACGGDKDKTDVDAAPPEPDAATMTPDAAPGQTDAAPEQPDAAPVICNMLSNDAPEITVRRSTAPLPVPTGGTIVDGTYFLVSDVFHETPEDADLGPEQATAQYTGDTVQLILSQMGEEAVATTSTFSTSGATDISFVQSCPDELDLRWDQYSTDGDTLQLHYTTLKRVQTYARQ